MLMYQAFLFEIYLLIVATIFKERQNHCKNHFKDDDLNLATDRRVRELNEIHNLSDKQNRISLNEKCTFWLKNRFLEWKTAELVSRSLYPMIKFEL